MHNKLKLNLQRTVPLLKLFFTIILTISVTTFGLSIEVLNTGQVETLEGFTFSAGSYFKKKKLIHPGFLITHNSEAFLFDAGLGSNARNEFKSDMPFWAKPFFNFEQITNMFNLIKASKKPIPKIILSHLHFDHISGALDFKDSEIWTNQEEYDFFLSNKSWSIFPTTRLKETKWHFIHWKNSPYRSYEKHFDIFGDGQAVLVPMPGHTPGSLGLFLNFPSGDIVFFVGDAVWNKDAIDIQSPKFLVSRWLVDDDPAQLQKEIKRLFNLKKEFPNILFIPAHDLEAVKSLEKFKE